MASLEVSIAEEIRALILGIQYSSEDVIEDSRESLDKPATMNPTTLIEFHLFPFLPPEIRRQIWAHALPGPRIHYISRLTTGSAACWHSQHASSSCRAPLLLLCCRESYDEVLHHMKPLYLPSHEGTCLYLSDGKRPRIACCRHILINPRLDTVYLPGRPSTALGLNAWLCRPLNFSVIQTLAVDVGLSARWATGSDEGLTVPEIVRRLGNVKQLCLVSDYSQYLPLNNYLWCKSRQSDLPQRCEDPNGGAEGGWKWIEPPDRAMWQVAASSERKILDMIRGLEAEKDGYPDGKWSEPEVLMKFLKYERPPGAYIGESESLGYWSAPVTTMWLRPRIPVEPTLKSLLSKIRRSLTRKWPPKVERRLTWVSDSNWGRANQDRGGP